MVRPSLRAFRDTKQLDYFECVAKLPLAGPVAGPPHPSSAPKARELRQWRHPRAVISQRGPDELCVLCISVVRPVSALKTLELRRWRLRGGRGRPVRRHPRAVISQRGPNELVSSVSLWFVPCRRQVVAPSRHRTFAPSHPRTFAPIAKAAARTVDPPETNRRRPAG